MQRFLMAVLMLTVGLPPVHAGKYWVFFTDHGITARPAAVSNRAAARRILRGSTSTIGGTDGDVNRFYIRTVRAAGCSVITVSRWLNAVSIQAPASALVRVTDLGFVDHVTPVAVYRKAPVPVAAGKSAAAAVDSSDYGLMYPYLDQVHIPRVHEAGLTGSGILIGVFDTGFRLQHDAYNHIHVKAVYDFINNDTIVANQTGDPTLQDQHGTRVLSVLAGSDTGSYIGSAPEASFLLAKTEKVDEEIAAEEDYWIRALEWAESLGVDIVQSSLGYIDWYDYADMDGHTAPITLAAAAAIDRGVCIVVSAGNEGISSWQHITAPADAESIISVGSVTLSGSRSITSSTGPTADGRIKPELVACGEGVPVVNELSTTAYTYGYGTSFAAPIVAGTCALLLQKDGWLTPGELRRRLLDSGSGAATPDNYTGWGIPDAEKAARLSTIDDAAPSPVSPLIPLSSFPVAGTLRLRLPGNSPYTVRISDLTGRPLKTVRGPSGSTVSISLDGLKPGIYVLEAETGGIRLRTVMPVVNGG